MCPCRPPPVLLLGAGGLLGGRLLGRRLGLLRPVSGRLPELHRLVVSGDLVAGNRVGQGGHGVSTTPSVIRTKWLTLRVTKPTSISARTANMLRCQRLTCVPPS